MTRLVERPGQLVLRNRDALAAGDLLLFNPSPDHLFQELGAGRVSIWCQDFGEFHWFRDQGAEAAFGVLPDAGTLPAQVILFQPREKERLELLLHFLAAGMPDDGRLWLVGANQSGVGSAGKHLKKYFASAPKADSARHCKLFVASRIIPPPPFELAVYQQPWVLGSPEGELRLVSLPGVFSHGRLDRGTALLLETLSGLRGTERPAGSVLDFACGIGVIGMSLLMRDPALELTLLDSSALALESARQSLRANHLQATLLPSDGLTGVNQRYDWIVSNPPFHRGVSRDFDVTRRLIEQAGQVLARQGKMLLVCNRNLPYDKWLGDRFSFVETLASNNEYKVLRALRSKS